ncbi:MAG: M6 family metalloprotease domain-containing protein [Paludibacter sp.]
MKKFLFIVALCLLFINTNAAPPYPGLIKYTQPDGSEIAIFLKGDEKVHWAETEDGYTLLSNGKNGWEYATTDKNGDLKTSGTLARSPKNRTLTEQKLLIGLSKNIRFSPKQVSTLKSVWEAKFGSENLIGTGQFFKNPNINTTGADSRRKVFSPTGNKKLILLLIEYTDVKFTKSRQDFVDLMNSQNYNLNGAEGSVKDYFSEISYNQFTLQTDVAPQIYTANNDMAYYGAPNGSLHDIRAYDLMLEAVQKADPDVDFSQYDNDGDGSVDGVYIIYAGYGEASSGLVNTIWPHASSIIGQTFDGKAITKYSCSNELNANGTLTSIGVICHEFGHVCGAPDYYDTDYATGGEYIGVGNWDVMDRGLYNTTTAKSGSKPAHLNPMEKVRAGWATPIIITNATNLTIPDITSNPSIYIYNTATANEYFMLENRQKTGFNGGCPGHGLMIYHYSKTYWDAYKNRTAPQGFYPVCANAGTSPTLTSGASSYGNINTSGCPFPGTTVKNAFYDTGTPSSKSWAGVNTGLSLTNISENGNGTVSLIVSQTTTCNLAPTTQASAFVATPIAYNSMNISWTRGSGNKVLVVAHESSAVDFNPVSGTNYTANANFTAGDEIGAENYVVYNGTGNSVTLTGLSGGLTYYYAVYEYNSADICYLKPALTGLAITDCVIDPTAYIENFEQNALGCWTATDHTGQGNWKTGTYSNRNYTPALSGKFAYFASETNIAHSYNADLISPTFDLSSYAHVELRFKHLLDTHESYPSSGSVWYSINNGNSWTQLATYTSDTSNAEDVALAINAAAGQSQVKFKWNYTCAPTGAYFWAIDGIQVVDTSVLIIRSGETVTLSTPTVLNKVIIQSDASLIVSAGNQLTVNGTFTNNAGNNGFILQSNASGTATFVDNLRAPNTVSGSVQQHLNAQRNWYMSLPVSTFAVPQAQDYLTYYYPENSILQTANNGAFWDIPTENMLSTIGYIVNPSAEKTGVPITFSGILNSGSKTTATLTNSPLNNQSKHGYNLIGNPYPSYLNIMPVINNNAAVEKTIWYKTCSAGLTPTYQFETVQTETGIGTNNSGTGAVTGYIPPMQAFWVKVNAETTLTFDNSMRTHASPLDGNTILNTTPLKTKQTYSSAFPILRVQVSNATNYDEAILYFTEYASDEYDQFDAPKMSNGNSAIPEIYTIAGTEKLVINGLSGPSSNKSISLGFNTGASNTFSIKATQVDNFEINTRIILRDNTLGTEMDITNGAPYVFTSDIIASDNRFELIFKTVSTVTELSNKSEKQNFNIAKNANNQLIVSCNSAHPELLSIYNAVGQKIFNSTICNTSTVIDKQFSPGVYLVKVNNQTQRIFF